VLFLLLCLTISSSVLAAQQQSAVPTCRNRNASAKEVDQLRKEVNELREDLKRLHTLLESRGAVSETAIAPAPQPAAALQPAAPSTGVVAQAAQPAPGETGVPQYTGRSDDPGVAMATKSSRRRLVRCGKSLRTDRVTVGGYGDFSFERPRSLSARMAEALRRSRARVRPGRGSSAVAKAEHSCSILKSNTSSGRTRLISEQAFIDGEFARSSISAAELSCPHWGDSIPTMIRI